VSLGEKIHQARLESCLAVTQFARRDGASRRAVFYWEADKRRPGFDFMVRIARVTGRPVESFGEEAEGDAAADQAVHR
jgi:transcriptional regulator with XRE-family HTH domain